MVKKTPRRCIVRLRLNIKEKEQGKVKVKYKLTPLKGTFVYARRSVQVYHFIGFIHIEIANSLKANNTADNVLVYLTLSYDVSCLTREAKEGQVKGKFDAHSHPGTCIVQPDGNRDASGVDAFPLTIQSSSTKPGRVSRVTILQRCNALYGGGGAANGGGAAMPSMTGARTKKMDLPLK